MMDDEPTVKVTASSLVSILDGWSAVVTMKNGTVHEGECGRPQYGVPGVLRIFLCADDPYSVADVSVADIKEVLVP
jgi:hypothetical protein